MGVPRAIAVAVATGLLAGCSLIAPSDRELMGGGTKPASDSGVRDGGDAGTGDDASGDAEPAEGGGCFMAGQRCTSTSECCMGLFCTGHSCR